MPQDLLQQRGFLLLLLNEHFPVQILTPVFAGAVLEGRFSCHERYEAVDHVFNVLLVGTLYLLAHECQQFDLRQVRVQEQVIRFPNFFCLMSKYQSQYLRANGFFLVTGAFETPELLVEHGDHVGYLLGESETGELLLERFRLNVGQGTQDILLLGIAIHRIFVVIDSLKFLFLDRFELLFDEI